MGYPILASGKVGDPANPERHPQRFLKIKCAQCKACTFDRIVGRCLAGGPFNDKLEFSDSHCQII